MQMENIDKNINKRITIQEEDKDTSQRRSMPEDDKTWRTKATGVKYSLAVGVLENLKRRRAETS